MIFKETEESGDSESFSEQPKVHDSSKTRKTGAIAIEQPIIILTKKGTHTAIVEVADKTDGNNAITKDNTAVKIKKVTTLVNVNKNIDCEKRCNDFDFKENSINSNEILSDMVKRNSTTISVSDEIKRSLSRTKLISISMIKNIFKKSKHLNQNNNSKKIISKSKSDEPVVPNFIFKYSREEFVDEELPHSAKYGFFRLCCTTFAISLNTLVCGIILGFTFTPDLALLSIHFSTDSLVQNNILEWTKYAFVGGCLVSCLVWWHISNLIGRRKTNLLSSFIYLLCFLAFLFSFDYNYILIAYVLGGISSASCFINSYFYIPECAEDRMKVITSVIFISLLWVGLYLSNLVIYHFSFIFLMYMSLFLTIMSFIFVFLLPESPVFYVQKNDLKRARQSIRWFKHRDSDLLVSYELTLIISRFTETSKALSLACFRSRANLNALYLSLLLMTGSTLNTSIFFSLYPNIVKLFIMRLNFLSLESIVFLFPVIMLLMFVQFYQNSRRKKMLIVSYSIVTLTLVVLSICLNFISFNNDTGSIEESILCWLILICFLVFSANAILCSFVVPHILFFEMFSYETITLCLSILYIFSFLIYSLLLILSSFLSSNAALSLCLFLASLLFLILIKLIIIYLPETKGDSFQQTMKRLRNIRTISRKKKVSIFTIGDGEVA